MIPYDDLVAALASWRERQGLPVRRESLFEANDSRSAVGGADALSMSFIPAAAQPAAADPDTGETRLATEDVLGHEEILTESDDESTFIGTAPAWSEGGGGGPAAAVADDTGESLVTPAGGTDAAPEELSSELSDEIDAALAEGGEPAPAPPDRAASGQEAFIPASTDLNTPLPAAPEEDDPLADAERDDEVTFAAGGASWAGGDAAAESPSPDQPHDAPADVAMDDEVSVDDSAILGEDLAPGEGAFEPATEIRDPAGAGAAPGEFLPPEEPADGDAEIAVDADDVLDASEDPGGAPDDEDPFRP